MKAGNWPEKVTPPTLREVVAGMDINASEADMNLRRQERVMQTLTLGSKEHGEAAEARLRWQCDLRHWRAQRARWAEILRRYPELADEEAGRAHGLFYGREPRPAPPAKVLPIHEDDDDSMPF